MTITFQEPLKDAKYLEFYRPLFGHRPHVSEEPACSKESKCVTLRFEDEVGSDCDCEDKLANYLAQLPAVQPRASRMLQLVLVIRKGSRRFLNLLEIQERLAQFCKKYLIKFTPVSMEILSPVEQVLLLAQTDIFVGLHGSGIQFSMFMPKRSVVLEIMPHHFQQCLSSGCHLHQEMIWIEAVSHIVKPGEEPPEPPPGDPNPVCLF